MNCARPLIRCTAWQVAAGGGTALALAALLASTAIPADCPVNTIWSGCYDGLPSDTSLPGASISDYLMPAVAWQASDPCPRACYDLRAGVLIASGDSDPWGTCFSAPEMFDDYQIQGISGDTPISFEARLHVQGTLTTGASIWAGLGEEPIIPISYEFYSESVDTTLTLPLEHRAGEKFLIGADLYAWGAPTPQIGESRASATLRFSGLPPGAYVISCQGYNVPVQALTTSWGRVKAIYR